MAPKKPQTPAKHVASPKRTKALLAAGVRTRSSPAKTASATISPNGKKTGKKRASPAKGKAAKAAFGKSRPARRGADTDTDYIIAIDSNKSSESTGQPRGKSTRRSRISPSKTAIKSPSKVPIRQSTSKSQQKPSLREVNDETLQQLAIKAERHIAFMSRFNGTDSYAKVLRSHDKTAYDRETAELELPVFAPLNDSANPNGYSERIQKADFERAQARGLWRARRQDALHGIDAAEQDIPHVDYAGIKRPISSPGRSHTPSRDARSSPRKTSAHFARIPVDSGKTGLPRKRSAAAAADTDDDEVNKRPEKRSRGRSSGSPTSKPRSPRVRAAPGSKGKAPEHAFSEGQPSGTGRGAVTSAANPRYIPGTLNPNPFFETMPAPEVWHRHMAPCFPFGETPFTERVMSNQINEDLARSHNEDVVPQERPKGLLARGAELVRNAAFGRKAPERQPAAESAAVRRAREYTASPWELPEVDDDDVAAVLNGGHPRFGRSSSSSPGRHTSIPPPNRTATAARITKRDI